MSNDEYQQLGFFKIKMNEQWFSRDIFTEKAIVKGPIVVEKDEDGNPLVSYTIEILDFNNGKESL